MLMASSQQDIIIRQSPAQQRQWQRFRGNTILILEELQNSGGMTVAEIAEKVGTRCRDIKEYCRRLYWAGCLDRVEKWGWKITPDGVFLLLLQLNNTKATQRQHKGNTKATLKQLTLSPYSDPTFSDAELAVTNLLISHYQSTSEKFVFVKSELDLCEKLSLPPDILRGALAKLRQDGVCYLWWDRAYSLYQLRLKPGFLERVRYV